MIGPVREPSTWVEHDGEHERIQPYSRTGGSDSRAYVLDESAWPDLRHCAACGRYVLPRQGDDPASFLDRVREVA